MPTAPLAADFPLDVMRPARACAPHLAASFAGASLGVLLAQFISSGLMLSASLENGVAAPTWFVELVQRLPGLSDGAAIVLNLLLCLLGALLGWRLSVPGTGGFDRPPAADEPLLSWVRAGDVVELQFASGTWLLVRAQVNDRQWRNVQRLLVWSRRMARGAAA